MLEKTLFEKICAKEIPATLVHEDDRCVAFRDISPQAPVHIWSFPAKQSPAWAWPQPVMKPCSAICCSRQREIARREGIAETGYRLVINNGRDGGEAVPHLHVHLLGGRQTRMAPGLNHHP